LRRVAFALEAFLPGEAMVELGVSRATMYRLIEELRDRFKKLGLDEYAW
jgi:hypothetical protein